MTVRIINADVFEGLAQLDDESVQMVCTSPPYWGLRNYNIEGQLGLEPTLSEHIDKMVAVFAEVHRVLRKDGTLWLNYGDAYCSTDKWGGGGQNTGKQTIADDGKVPSWAVREKRQVQPGFKPKDLYMIPNRLAIALQEWGWWVRSEIIWAKPNPMPESIKDRPTSSHEKIWLLSKSQRYFYDADAVRECSDWTLDGSKMPDGWDTGPGAHGSHHRNGREKGKKQGWNGSSFTSAQDLATKPNLGMGPCIERPGRNLRNVWEIATQAYPDAHFATFPTALAERCIKAGSKPGDMILDPFGGAGTTGLVADKLGRNAILIELNPEYAAMAARRIHSSAPLFAQVGVEKA
jgi:DNA modification methylase